MTRLKRLSNFLKSLRFRIFLIFCILGIVPGYVFRIGVLKSYEDRAVSIKSSEILSQSKILANQIVAGNYLSDVTSSDIITAELEQLSNIYDGRIMLVDGSFRIVKDTYDMDEGKTIISQEVVQSYLGQEIQKYDSENRYIEMTIPLTETTDTAKNVIGVMLISVSTDSIQLNTNYLRNNMLIL